jgi:hypothetical protein
MGRRRGAHYPVGRLRGQTLDWGLATLLVLFALAAYLDGDENDDHVYDHADPEERGQQAYVLAESLTCD